MVIKGSDMSDTTVRVSTLERTHRLRKHREVLVDPRVAREGFRAVLRQVAAAKLVVPRGRALAVSLVEPIRSHALTKGTKGRTLPN